jgi:aldehyde dehydrogenase (NAD+)
MDRYENAYVGGKWTPSTGTGRIPVENPATEEVLASVPDGTVDDVDAAVGAARVAFPGWAATDRADRAGYLAALRDGLRERREELADLITAELGAPYSIARAVQVDLPVTVLDSYVKMLGEPEAEEHIGHSLVLREPAGVVGAITPWNYPLHQTIAKVAAALAAGCTVIHKPSEVAPLSAFALAEVVDAVTLPPGVYNLVSGTGRSTGAALAGHAGLDLVSFTGSTRAGREVAALAAGQVTRVALELGGKSANVILPDADLATAVKVGVGNYLLNSGQTCTALTRMLVPRNRHDEAVDLAVKAAARYLPGDPTHQSTRLGPLVSRAQRDRVLDYIAAGRKSGATLALDGTAGLPAKGYFVGPTIFAGVDPSSVIAQEEIFGPVLCVIPYEDEDDAVRIANSTPYGLAGAVWAGDRERAVAVARRLRTGQVDINGGRFNPGAPFGGYGRSGYGRELGPHGLAEFQQIKSLQLG